MPWRASHGRHVPCTTPVRVSGPAIPCTVHCLPWFVPLLLADRMRTSSPFLECSPGERFVSLRMDYKPRATWHSATSSRCGGAQPPSIVSQSMMMPRLSPGSTWYRSLGARCPLRRTTRTVLELWDTPVIVGAWRFVRQCVFMAVVNLEHLLHNVKRQCVTLTEWHAQLPRRAILSHLIVPRGTFLDHSPSMPAAGKPSGLTLIPRSARLTL